MERKPETGTAARTLAASCVAIAGNGAVVFGYPGIASPYWQASFGVGRGAVGATLFFMLGAIGLLMYPVGRWQERLGTRRLVFAGQALTAGALVLAAFAPSMAAIYLWAFAVGAASCFVYIPTQTAAQLWWPRRRGLASGVVNLAFAGSAAVMAPAFRAMTEALGYRAMNLVTAGAILVVGGVSAAFVVRPAGAPAGSGPEVPSLTARQSLGTRALWLLWAVWAMQGAAGIAMVTLATTVGRLKGFTPDRAVALLVAFGAANGVSRIAMGALSDAVGRQVTLCAAFAAAGAAYLALPLAHTPATAAALTALVGVAFGTLFAVSAPLILECFGPAHFGAVFGLVFTAYGFVAGILGPWLSGHLLDVSDGNLALVCGYLGALCLASSGLVLGVRPPGAAAAGKPAKGSARRPA